MYSSTMFEIHKEYYLVHASHHFFWGVNQGVYISNILYNISMEVFVDNKL